MALSGMNEADMRGLTEMKPGSKMLIQVHSYSLAAANTQAPQIWGVPAHSHQRTSGFIRPQKAMQI